MPSRRMGMSRRFLIAGTAAGALAGGAQPSQAGLEGSGQNVSLDGVWQFRLDADGGKWRDVIVPHTWQVEPANADYLGVAWYRREFHAPEQWRGLAVRIEFEAVFHSADVQCNGQTAGAHRGKGYTAFAFDISRRLRYGARNEILVRVDNSFDDSMLPRGRSYDWTPDGGIYRPVRLLVTPAAYIDRLEVEAAPDLSANTASVTVKAITTGGTGVVRYEIFDELTGDRVLYGTAGEPATLKQTRLWHFDDPNLYRVRATFGAHALETTFGIREIRVSGGGLYLNGERVWLAGVERMAGSNPLYGMAEPSGWIEHDHVDMKNLNCVFTRVHWQQDRRVLDWCDRHGILIQEEVPTWGADTFKGMAGEPSPDLMENGLGQLREMIQRDRNHPSIISWGLCNEIGGQDRAAAAFARNMLREAKRLDPRRLCSYASNSLQTTPERNVSGEMDFIEWNEYYETWYKGGVEAVRTNLAAIRQAFPGKMIVISEYGYCECAPDRVEGDPARTRILREHNRIFREFPEVGGLIFFDYNDYRTHIGDKGVGALKQRVHGVVDLFGARKPSYADLRGESSPIDSAEIEPRENGFALKLVTRNTAPAYTLRGYTVRAVRFTEGRIPVEERVARLPTLKPGQRAAVEFNFSQRGAGFRVEVLRPTGFSVWSQEWYL